MSRSPSRQPGPDGALNAYSAAWFALFLDPIAPEQTEAEVAFLTRVLPLPRHRRVLDVCCGSGRHARLLARAGYRVTGVDRDAGAIAAAVRRSTPAETYLRLDVRRLDELVGSFDAVLCLWQSFGYFDAPTNRSVLAAMAGKLGRSGRLVLDLYHRGFFAGRQAVRRVERGGLTVTSRQTLEGDRLRVELEYQDRGGDVFEWQLYTPEEITALAGEVGLTPVLRCAGFDVARPPSGDEPRMQLVLARR